MTLIPSTADRSVNLPVSHGAVAHKPMNDELTWQEQIVAEQLRQTPKERGRTYYYTDGLEDDTEMWLKHSPGMDICMRVNKLYPREDSHRKDYFDSLQMNIGTELDALKLYLALEAYFNDKRSHPYFLKDVEVDE